MYKLIRNRDNLIRRAPKIKWIEFDETGKYLKDHENPQIGFSLLLSPFNIYFTWMTTLVTEILEQKDNYIHFKTENSEYELFKENMIEGNEFEIYNDLLLDKYLSTSPSENEQNDELENEM